MELLILPIGEYIDTLCLSVSQQMMPEIGGLQEFMFMVHNKMLKRLLFLKNSGK